MREYAVIYEQGENNWGAIVPDLPGCVSNLRRSAGERQGSYRSLPGSTAGTRRTHSGTQAPHWQRNCGGVMKSGVPGGAGV